MQPDQRDAAYLWDMLDAAQTTQQLSSGQDFTQYSTDRRTQLAIERSLEIIGEAAGGVHGGSAATAYVRNGNGLQRIEPGVKAWRVRGQQ